jgi:Icc-related predicted phosphoesterase
MKILAFTDFHGNQEAYQRAEEVIAAEKPELVIVAGDITNYDLKRAKQLLSDLANAGRPVYFVPGNMDNTELGKWPGNENVHALHGRCEHAEGIALIGLGASPHGPFSTPFEYSEEEAAELLTEAMKGYHGGMLILVSHCPPKDTKVDRVSSGEHAGSTSVRKFVEKTQPLLVVSGHIHEAQGADTIGSSTLVNTGPARQGHFAEITLDDKATVKFAKLF